MANNIIQTTAVALGMLLAQTVSASIESGAPSASHHFEEAAADIHEYLHDNYADSYGSHGLEAKGTALHGVLHDWQHGEATEADVVKAMDALKLEWNNFRQTINPAGVLNTGDIDLNDHYEAVKDAYKEVRYLLRKAR